MTPKATVPASLTLPGRAGTRAQRSFFKRWSFAGMAILMIAVSIAGFAPAIVNPTGRHGPISTLAAVHGTVVFSWLLLYLVQSLLVRSGRVAWHRRLGFFSILLLALLVLLGYQTTMAMVRRGYDLSGDQGVGFNAQGASLDAQTASVFNLVDLAWFTLLALAALCFRERPAIHKRLMLFANVQLMGASITHLLGHTGLLSVGGVIGSFALFLLAAVARDWIADRRIHRITIGLAIVSLILLPVEGALIGPSAAWHHLVSWLARGT